jgi:hypothetical protein
VFPSRIWQTLSEKLSAARLNQRESEERLKSRLSARMGGVSPAALAAKRLGGGEVAEVEDRPRQRPGATAEVMALLKQNQQKDDQVKRLERSLTETKTELSDLKLIIALLISLGVVQVATSFAVASFSSGGWQSFSELAASELAQVS